MLKTMNFDIKYTKNLKSMNFIKIKQVLGTILGVQSWGHLTRPLNRSGYTMGIPNMPTDKVGPTYQWQREEIRERGFTRFGLSLNLTNGSHPQPQGFTCAMFKQYLQQKSAEFKTQPIRPLGLRTPGLHTPCYLSLYGLCAPDLFKL